MFVQKILNLFKIAMGAGEHLLGKGCSLSLPFALYVVCLLDLIVLVSANFLF